ncbi:MAG: N-6 DNA methylase [Sedimentisphaerales bacterium]|nr:N-6 DNA methylase [Sedimentisphaerales bacterium]
MLYKDAHQFFGWPARPQVFDPKGAGARAYADEVKRKIGLELHRQFPNLAVETGILAADPNSDNTEAPIAVVCEFPSGANDEALKQAHRLAWNFSRTALLITLEPHRLLAWSCWLNPQQETKDLQVQELRELPRARGGALNALQSSARDLLHWVSLITGNYLKQQPKKFRSGDRADALLLENLKVVRRELLLLGLVREYCHDLLARIIFAQFLFHRKDSDGRPFLDKNLLSGRCEGELKHVHEGLDTILANGDETYRLFRWLDRRFNGDLFPGKENQTNAERNEAWRQEQEAVTENPAVLTKLSEFVSGKLQLKDRQLTLWPEYSFDVIPLEFISSMYEEFLTEDKDRSKAYYTPSHLVDFVLDGVLPWNDDRYDLKVLDPCCGSGIFLVKAFQRLIHRWRRVHNREPLVSDLKPLLANNLWGVDRDPEAVRVACFSLYLAMADAIEPKYYLKREKVFPRLRGIRLLDRDFFGEETPGVRTPQESTQSEDGEAKFDLVVGNAPWGDNSIKSTSDAIATSVTSTGEVPRKSRKKEAAPPTKAEIWAKRHGWPVANNDIGPLFLAKGASLLRRDGQVAMVQPASTLLYQRAGNAEALRQKLFSRFTFDGVTNLSAIRFELFPEAVGPACVVTFGKAKPSPQETFLYFYPKPLRDEQAGKRLIIEPHDVNQITHSEAERDPLVWVTLAVGARRDLELVRRLSNLSSLAKLHAASRILKREGIIRGNLGREEEQIRGKRLLDSRQFPPGSFVELDVDSLPIVEDCRVDAAASKDFEAFKLPQLLIKQTWRAREGRFCAAVVRSSDPEWGAICTQSYLSIRDLDRNGTNVKAAWLAYNSLLATYFLTATSSRIGHYRQEGLVREMLNVPLPPYSPGMLDGVHSPADVDARIRKAIRLTEAQWILVEDFVKFVIPEAMQKRASDGRRATVRSQGKGQADEASELQQYARFFLRVLKATFGKDKAVCATVFVEPTHECLPVRMVAVHLDWPGRRMLTVEPMDKDALFEQLRLLYKNALSPKSRAASSGGLGFQRVAFLFHSHVEGARQIPSLYIIKPDQRRYWTRSLAMRDADRLAGTILHARGPGESKS